MPKTTTLRDKKRTQVQRRRSAKRVIVASTRAPRARKTRTKKRVTAGLLKEMTRRLVNEFDPEQVILFGSRAWGKPKASSDIDLMVIVSASEDTEYQRMVRAYHAFGDLIVPTDVLVKTRAEFDFFAQVPASLQNAIVRKGKILYDRSEKTVGAKLVHQGAA